MITTPTLPQGLLRLSSILQLIPVSKSAWFAGSKQNLPTTSADWKENDRLACQRHCAAHRGGREMSANTIFSEPDSLRLPPDMAERSGKRSASEVASKINPHIEAIARISVGFTK